MTQSHKPAITGNGKVPTTFSSVVMTWRWCISVVWATVYPFTHPLVISQRNERSGSHDPFEGWPSIYHIFVSSNEPNVERLTIINHMIHWKYPVFQDSPIIFLVLHHLWKPWSTVIHHCFVHMTINHYWDINHHQPSFTRKFTIYSPKPTG